MPLKHKWIPDIFTDYMGSGIEDSSWILLPVFIGGLWVPL